MTTKATRIQIQASTTVVSLLIQFEFVRSVRRLKQGSFWERRPEAPISLSAREEAPIIRMHRWPQWRGRPT